MILHGARATERAIDSIADVIQTLAPQERGNPRTPPARQP
jgi:hypothetical protein